MRGGEGKRMDNTVTWDVLFQFIQIMIELITLVILIVHNNNTKK